MNENYQKEEISKNKDNIAKDLLISFKFPPLTDVSGIVLSKRAITANKIFDVIHGPINDENIDNDFNDEINKFIDKRMTVEGIKTHTQWPSIKEFKDNGLKLIEKTVAKKEILNYETIHSRAWLIESHFLALEYKLKHPETQWIAEFSDPLRVNIENKNRFNGNELEIVNDKEFIERINLAIDKINKTNNHNIRFQHINQNNDIFFLGEYLPFIFADKIIFTNKNQRKIMLNIFPYSEIKIKEINKFKEFIINKSEIKKHPTLDNDFYRLKENTYPLSKNTINLGYFGTYLGKRNLEDIYYALSNLDKEITSETNIQLYCFVSNPGPLHRITEDLKTANNIKIGPQLPLLEFLNLTTKLDVLIVNDTFTKDYFEVNPYLPSKLADYLGSKTDIWGICEKGSIMEHTDLKYKSYVNDYESSLEVLNKIIKDKLKIEYNSREIMKDNIYKKQNNYLKRRITDLNNIFEEFSNLETIKNSEIQRLIKENNELKEKNNEILNSNSWKITKNFRKIKNKTQKIKNKKHCNKNKKIKNKIQKMKEETKNNQNPKIKK